MGIGLIKCALHLIQKAAPRAGGRLARLPVLILKQWLDEI